MGVYRSDSPDAIEGLRVREDDSLRKQGFDLGSLMQPLADDGLDQYERARRLVADLHGGDVYLAIHLSITEEKAVADVNGVSGTLQYPVNCQSNLNS